jgi:hypothetical protein
VATEPRPYGDEGGIVLGNDETTAREDDADERIRSAMDVSRREAV